MWKPASQRTVGPIVVEVTRGDVVEARHVVHAVVLREGRLELAAGDPALVTYLRSSAKPIQALTVARARPDLDDEQIALACASHRATPAQLAVVRRTLAGAPAGEDDLECGPAPTPIEHNCSGKHAALLALCRAESWPIEGYRSHEHPCQQRILSEVAELAELRPAEIPLGVDGCGVPTFALSLERSARAFWRLRGAEGSERVARAMSAHPQLLLGPVDLDTRIAETLEGWVAKGGAEGLLCAASSDEMSVAVKVVDGSFRPLACALAHLLSLLGMSTDGLGDDVVRSSRGEEVGVIRIAA